MVHIKKFVACNPEHLEQKLGFCGEQRFQYNLEPVMNISIPHRQRKTKVVLEQELNENIPSINGWHDPRRNFPYHNCKIRCVKWFMQVHHFRGFSNKLKGE